MCQVLQGRESFASGKTSQEPDLQAALLVAGYKSVMCSSMGDFRSVKDEASWHSQHTLNTLNPINKSSSCEAETLAAIV